MSFLNFFFIYILVWWISLFIVLPMGVETNTKPEKGMDTGAPQKASMKRKLVINSVLALVISVVISLVVYVFGAQIENYYIQTVEV